MKWDHLIRERHRWHRYARSFLVVALEVPPASLSAAPLALSLAKALVTLENSRRTGGGVLLAELDFWSPGLAKVASGESRATASDLLDIFEVLAKDPGMQSSLRRNEGIPSSVEDLQLWQQCLATEWPAVDPAVEGIILLPARTGKEAAERGWQTSPSRFRSVRSKPAPLPGAFVLRALMAAAAERYRPGIILLTLPSGWNGLSSIVMSGIADVLILASKGEGKENDHWEAVLHFVRTRRQSSATRPESEEEIHLFLPERRTAKPVSQLEDFRKPVVVEPRLLKKTPTNVLEPLARMLDHLATLKESGVGSLAEEAEGAADGELLSKISSLTSRSAALKILVEEGPYGEYPIRNLSDCSRDAMKRLAPVQELKGFRLEPVAIRHDQLLQRIQKPKVFETWLKEERIDLLTFPHYMLGALAEADLLLPWHVMEEAAGQGDGPPIVSAAEIAAAFHKVDEMCRYNGVLFALPYSLLQKLLLVKKKGKEKKPRWEEEPRLWDDVKARIELEIPEGKNGSLHWPLLLETKFDHVGPWYDWLEFVNAYGGADFRPLVGVKYYRGSDYGECWINHPWTVKGTAAYLRFLRRSLECVPEPVDWDGLLNHFMKTDDIWVTTAWSDIVGYHWKKSDGAAAGREGKPIGLRERVDVFSFPLGDAKEGRTSVEGWVLAIPRVLEETRRRFAARAASWFLSAEVQRRYAEVGGNTARRNLGHALGQIPRTVHRSLFFPLVEPALKMTFREAPAIIEAISSRLRTWLADLQKEAQEPQKETLEERLDELAREVSSELLRDKARYRPLQHWRQLLEEGTLDGGEEGKGLP